MLIVYNKDKGDVFMKNNGWGINLIRISAVFGLIGAVLGSHMAGSGSYVFKPVHAHMLVVGWLSMFAWGIFYSVYEVRLKKLVSAQCWTGIIGTVGLVLGMLLQSFSFIDSTLSLILYIVGGTVLLVSFGLFIISTFFIKENK